jgi:hypothetical protein
MCSVCKDELIVWNVGKFGMTTCSPCPVCNKNGVKVERRQKELEKLRKSL